MSQPAHPSSTGDNNRKPVKCSSSDCWCLLQKLRSDCPLVQCITNYVSMDIMANTLLAIGASPAMVHGGLNILMLTNEGNLEKFMTPTTIFLGAESQRLCCGTRYSRREEHYIYRHKNKIFSPDNLFQDLCKRKK